MRHLAFVSLACLLALCAVASADLVVVHDQFNDGILDPAWNVEFSAPATGCTYTEDDSMLVVTDISTTPSSEWGKIVLTRTCQLSADFTASILMSWDAEASNHPMQGLHLALIDSAGSWTAYCGFTDAWVAHSGRIVIGGDDADANYYGPLDQLDFSGVAAFRIERSGTALSFYWDDQLMAVGSASETTITDVELSFWYSSQSPSFFGTESVDFVTVIEVESPVTASSWGRLKALYREPMLGTPPN